MMKCPVNPYSRKKVENGDSPSSIVSKDRIVLNEQSSDIDMSTETHVVLEGYVQNTRKRPLPPPLAGDQHIAPLSIQQHHTLQVEAAHMVIPLKSHIYEKGESTDAISHPISNFKIDQHLLSNLDSEQPTSIHTQSKSFNDFHYKDFSDPTLQVDVASNTVATREAKIPPMIAATGENNVQDNNFEEYDSNFDWNAIALQIDLDQISCKASAPGCNNNNLKVAAVSTDYTHGASIPTDHGATGLHDQYGHARKTFTTTTEVQDNATNDFRNIQSSISHSYSTTLNYIPGSNELKLLNYDKSRVAAVDDEYKQQLIKNADLNGVLSNGWKLLSHQKAGVLRALTMRRMVLAFDMGTGKTLVGCVWAKAFKLTFPNIQVFIICPVSLAEDWGRTAWEATRLECEFDDKKISAKTNKAKTATDSVQSSPTCKIFSWAKVPPVPTNVEKFIIICDEAHQMQNTETSRTKETLNLALSERCLGVLLLTGTPMKNGRPSNIFPLLKAVRHPFGDDQYSFEVTFCNGRFKHFKNTRVWDASGASNLTVLNAHIATHVLCKNKEDCLRDLPPKTREYKTVQVSSRFELQYAHAMNELAKIQDLVDQCSDDEIKSEAVLGAFQIVRLIASKAKVDATVSMAKSILEKESSIVIFTFFVDVAKEIHKKLRDNGWNGEVLAGDVPPTKRQAMVDKFQSGITPVFIATYGAGAVGLTLTAACSIILVDRPWTPGDAYQAEDRVRRIGQTRHVRSIWMRGFDVDLHIDNMIEQKNHNATTVVDGRSARAQINATADAPRVSLRSLIQNLIVKNSSTIKELQNICNPS